MAINLILNVDESNAIGYSDGRLAHRIKEDLERFKRLTSGCTVLMGRKTFESLNMPNGLPNRLNVVLSSAREPTLSDVLDITLYESNVLFWSSSAKSKLVDAVEAFTETQLIDNDLWIIGGATVADEALTLDLVDNVYLTLVHAKSDADVKLKHNLSSYEQFVLDELSAGRSWTIESVDYRSVYSFVLIKRVRSV
jgi:dihydrofolate reductase